MLWKEKYRIGVELIDSQHEELFRRVSDFMSILRSQGKWEEKVAKVNETMAFMSEYVVTHFRDEEELQEKVGYPDMESHHKIHAEMVDYVVQVSKQYQEEGYKEELIQQFAGKLLAWLINHVAASDQQIADYVKSQEVSA